MIRYVPVKGLVKGLVNGLAKGLAKGLVVFLACVPLTVLAQQPKQASAANVAKATATVESVDQESRSLVLRNSAGDRMLVVAGPEVRNFEQIEVGDRVAATYQEAILAEVLPKGSQVDKGDKGDTPRSSVAKSRAEPGERPAGAVSASVSTDVVIESVDQSFDTVTFRRPDGIVRTVAVNDPKATQFIQSLKPGDEVRVTYTEAMAIAVTPEP